jgi:hypothetical protein
MIKRMVPTPGSYREFVEQRPKRNKVPLREEEL